VDQKYVKRCQNHDGGSAHCCDTYQKSYAKELGGYCFMYNCGQCEGVGDVCLMTATPHPLPSISPGVSLD
jgi:hypothetical protein